MYTKRFILCLLTLTFVSCVGIQSGDELSNEKKSFIESLTILEDGEDVIQCYFSSFSSSTIGLNLYSNKRLLTYWSENSDSFELHQALYSEIDTIEFVDHSDDWVNNSYLKVYTSEVDFFNVFISGTFEEEKEFYQGAIKVWEASK